MLQGMAPMQPPSGIAAPAVRGHISPARASPARAEGTGLPPTTAPTSSSAPLSEVCDRHLKIGANFLQAVCTMYIEVERCKPYGGCISCLSHFGIICLGNTRNDGFPCRSINWSGLILLMPTLLCCFIKIKVLMICPQ